MNFIKKSLEDKIQLWCVLGPFVLLLTLFSTLVKSASHSWYLVFAVFVGIPLCWRWGMRGLMGAIGFLVLLFALFYTSFSADECLWQMGIALTVMLGFVITALAFRETSHLIRSLELESQSRMDSLLSVEKKLQEEKTLFEKTRIDLETTVDETALDLRNQIQESKELHNLLDVLHKETGYLHENKKDLLEESFQKTRQILALEFQMAEANESIQRLKSLSEISNDERVKELNKELESIKELFKKKELELNRAAQESDRYKADESVSSNKLEKMEKQVDAFNQSLDKKSEHVRDLQEDILEGALFATQRQKQIESLEKEITKLDTHKKEALQIVAEKEGAIRNLNHNNSELTTALGHSQTIASEEEKNKLRLADLLENRQNEWQGKEKHFTGLMQQRDRAIQIQRDQLVDTQHKLQETQINLEEHQKQLQDATTSYTTLQQEQQVQQIDFDEKWDQSNKILQQKELQVTKQSEELVIVQQQLQEKEQIAEELQTSYEQLKSHASKELDETKAILLKEKDAIYHLRRHLHDARLDLFNKGQLSSKEIIEDNLAEVSQVQNNHWLFQMRALLTGNTMKKKEQLKDLPQDISEGWKSLWQVHLNYKQLRTQFEEKCTVLNQARVDLFEGEGKLLELEKEQTEIVYESDFRSNALEQDISTLCEQQVLYEEEINTLNYMIQNLLNELQGLTVS